MYRPEDVEKVLRTLPIREIWGIGNKYSKMLNSAGVLTAYDFTRCPSEWVRARMGVTGVRTWAELRGDSCIELDIARTDKQSISISRTFSKEILTFSELNSILSLFASTISLKLRKQGSCTTQITTFIYTNKYREDKPQSYESHLVKLDVPSDSTLEIIEIVSASLKKIYKEGYSYKRAGIVTSHFVQKKLVHNSLFDEIDRDKHSKLMKSMDSLNLSFGEKTIQVASHAGYKLEGSGSNLSPNYTTNWDEILKVKI